MLRFLLAGTATVGGLMLLFLTSFADPSALRAWRAAIPALPVQAQQEPAAPIPAEEQQPAATDAAQQQRATLQEQVRRLEAQLSDAMREMSDLQSQAAEAKRAIDDAERRRGASEAEQAAESAKSPDAKAQAATQSQPDSRQLEQGGAAPLPSAEVRTPHPVALAQPALALAPAGRASRPSAPRAARRADAGQRRGAVPAVTAPLSDRPDVALEGGLMVGESSAAETDATRSVIDRLRHEPQPPPPEPAMAVERAAQPALADVRRVAPRDRLAKARGAIAAGRIAEAQRLLEEAQLQLVFRPLTPTGGEPSTASRSAGQVADALTMLGSGDPGRAVQFIDQALAESGGAPAAVPPPYAVQDRPGAGTAVGRPYR